MLESYIDRSLVRRWKQQVRHASHGAIILSPYVTSQTAETVIQSYDHRPPRLYTLFDPTVFMQGSSSLYTLRKIINLGCAVFHISSLHAKLVIRPQHSCTIGSQNLTAGGTKRKEASVLITDPQIAGNVESTIQEWMDDATPVTLAMIDELELILPPFRRRYLALTRELEKEGEEILGANQGEARKKQERERRHQRLVAATSNAKTFGSKNVRLTHIQAGNWTLKRRDRSADLTQWYTGRKTETLDRTYRYLFLVPEMNKIAWARLMKTRITKFHGSISWTDPIHLFGDDHQIEMASLDPQEFDGNLRITLDRGRVVLDTWFYLDGLELIKCEFGSVRDGPASLRNKIISRWSECESILLKRLFRPFLYERRLVGEEANTFFERTHGTWTLHLGRMGRGRFILAT